MRILAIDSSTSTAAVGIGENGKTLISKFTNNGLTHSQTLMLMVAECLTECGLTMKQIDAVAVTVGPGSFTGVRIGISTAKGLAMGADIGVIPVSSLAALAENGAGEETLICPVFDARCGQVYNALFNGFERLTPDRALTIVQLREELTGKPVLLFGDGAELCAEQIPNVILATEEKRFIIADGILTAAQKGKPIDFESIQPVYLRLSQAEREREKKGRK
ncbi:MAG TPA: tRNA (adenosine(37)-N6)-threonylcarbamoyltransferase complex dimerization subunit type 1 TsaB [Oscillospiraceae bacterium]|nr:tRNA (adenosine(37)-N6)-threonylcarbamoyltransferase complex dimerization subunit type 1 TsaB [Oscillospiraceae bacterium]HPF57068.1 tRNA (adenosine(37)-N6)-threonylcarbamoyltransferase complex dimerization subunit type 1 TsaB [Clostridiales bacterium]HPK36581.1 tRNA (adenosine(37)-N6)-threonylcarbamoyltransferase complex dimerization subunit type 1 TsaB [Oscillospiraceae bacterium]HPR76801.1 tRNA (adenosine(37)-N6)-threonylcarbamoyltransferase complex dimerization subunit type 1 TsaB [Oscill